MLAVGTRFDALETSEWSLQLPETLVRIDVDAEAVGRNYDPDVAVVGDPKTVLGELINRFKGAANHRPARADEVSKLKSQVRDALRSRSPLAVRLNDEIREPRCRAMEYLQATSRSPPTGVGLSSTSTIRVPTSTPGHSRRSVSDCRPLSEPR